MPDKKSVTPNLLNRMILEKQIHNATGNNEDASRYDIAQYLSIKRLHILIYK